MRGKPTSERGGLSTGSAGDDFIIGTICFIRPLLPTLLPLPALALLGGTSSCEEEDDDDRKVRLWSLWLMPESGEVVQLVDDGGASSFERRVLSSSVDANATNRSNPELTRSCQLDSSSPTSSVVTLQLADGRNTAVGRGVTKLMLSLSLGIRIRVFDWRMLLPLR